MKNPSQNRFIPAHLKANKRHYLTSVISAFLLMFFISGTMFTLWSLVTSRENAASRDIGDYYGYFIHSDTFDFKQAVSDGVVEEYGNAHIVGFAYGDTSRNMGCVVAWLDDTAKKMYNPILLDGRYPEKKGEIAIESAVASQMGITAVADRDITLNMLSADSNGFSEDSRTMSFRIVGILSNKQSNATAAEDYFGLTKFMPSAFLSADSASLFDSEMLSAYFTVTKESAKTYKVYDELGYHFTSNFNEYMKTRVDNTLNTSEGYYVYNSDLNFTPLYIDNIRTSYIANNTSLIAVANTPFTVFLTLSVICALAVYNNVSSDIRERSRQTGLLRAIGTTKKQIIKGFLKENLRLFLLLLPFSVLFSYLFVLIGVKILGEAYVFSPKIVLFPIVLSLTLLCVLIISFIAIVKSASYSPMQLMRGTEGPRRKKKYRIKCKKSFNATSTLAKRNIRLYKGRNVQVSLMVFFIIIFSSVSYTVTSEIGFGIREMGDPNIYTVSSRYALNENDDIISDSAIPVQDVETLRKYPYFSYVYGSKEFSAETQQNDYTKLLGINSLGHDEPLDKEAIEEYLSVPADSLYSVPVYGIDEEYISMLSLEVYDGEIDFEKLNSGEEIIMVADPEISYRVYDVGETGYFFGVEGEELFGGGEVIYTLKNELRAGSEIMLKTTVDGKTGENTYKIGAVVMPYFSMEYTFFANNLSFITTSEGASQITGFNSLPYSKIALKLNDEFENNDTTDSFVYNYLCKYADKCDLQVTSNYLESKDDRTARKILVIICAAVSVIFLAICISTFNNSINNKIRSNKRQIGTLRAVGASKKDLSMIYIKEFLLTVCPPAVLGIGIYASFYRYVTSSFSTELPFALPPIIFVLVTIFLFCGLNLYGNIKKMTRYSAVENIRELN